MWGNVGSFFDRFYLVKKFILPTLDDSKLSSIKYDK